MSTKLFLRSKYYVGEITQFVRAKICTPIEEEPCVLHLNNIQLYYLEEGAVLAVN